MSHNVPSKLIFSKVAPFPVFELGDMTLEDTKPKRCPVELFRAKRGYEQCKLNFMTTVVKRYDTGVEPKRPICQSVSAPSLTNKTNNSKVKEVTQIESGLTPCSNASKMDVGKKGKAKVFRMVMRRLKLFSKAKVEAALEK